jgi:hypothetical protein
MIATDRTTRYLGFLDVREASDVATHRQVRIDRPTTEDQILTTQAAGRNASVVNALAFS